MIVQNVWIVGCSASSMRDYLTSWHSFVWSCNATNVIGRASRPRFNSSVFVSCSLLEILFLSRCASWLTLVAIDWVEHDLVLAVGLVASEALAPVVAAGVGEDHAISVEVRAADRLSCFWITLQSMLGILVPEVKRSVATGCAECAKYRVKADRVDCVDLLCRCLRPMTLEAEI